MFNYKEVDELLQANKQTIKLVEDSLDLNYFISLGRDLNCYIKSQINLSADNLDDQLFNILEEIRKENLNIIDSNSSKIISNIFDLSRFEIPEILSFNDRLKLIKKYSFGKIYKSCKQFYEYKDYKERLNSKFLSKYEKKILTKKNGKKFKNIRYCGGIPEGFNYLDDYCYNFLNLLNNKISNTYKFIQAISQISEQPNYFIHYLLDCNPKFAMQLTELIGRHLEIQYEENPYLIAMRNNE